MLTNFKVGDDAKIRVAFVMFTMKRKLGKFLNQLMFNGNPRIRILILYTFSFLLYVILMDTIEFEHMMYIV